MVHFDAIAFDADDTLWHNERLYLEAQAGLADLLRRYRSPQDVERSLYATESRNMEHYGYGIKAYALSMIETAVELTEGRISGSDVRAIIGLARDMLAAPVELLPQAHEAVSRLARTHRLLLVTKGDPRDQEAKLARSGLGAFFPDPDVVSDKTRLTYERLLGRYTLDPGRFLMVGNSLRSDVLPVLELGGQAVYIPYHTTWQHEAAEPPPPGQPGFHQLDHLGQLPALVDRLEQDGP
jgi:putative hydrolase of the HAD superfamily